MFSSRLKPATVPELFTPKNTDMKVIITETTAVASAIARALSVNNTVSAPGVYYDAKTAVIAIDRDFITPYGMGVLPGKDALPIVPGRYTYGIRLTHDSNGRHGIAAEDQAYADYIGELIRGGLEVIFASDGGADAQARFSNICRFFKVGVPTSRMWLTRLEKKAIRNAFETRVRGRALHNLAQSGLVSMAMDEAFKYNVTEAYRALFPRLAAPICRQDMLVLAASKNYLDSDTEARASHKPVTTHHLMVSGKVFDRDVQFYPTTTFDTKEDCEKAYSALSLPATLTSTFIDTDDEVTEAPALYILTTLQADAWERLGMPFSKTRDIAVRLYLDGLISSPLTSNPKLPESMRGYILKRFRWAKGYPFAADEEVPHTHGIITTGKKPFMLDDDSQKIYNLIAERFGAALSGATMTTELVIGIEIDGETFFGTMPWYCCDEVPASVEVTITGKSQSTHTTKTPDAPSMADLLGVMDTLMRSLSDRFNPGMPFTAATHDITDSLDRLRQNGLILDVCGEPAITADGKLLLETFNQTYALETLLAYQVEAERLYANRRMSRGGAALMAEFGKRIHDKTEQLITDSRLFPSTPDTHVCPICGRHSVLRYPRILKCHVCGFTMPLQFMGHKFTDREVHHLLTHRYTSPIKFLNRRGHEFYDAVVIGKGKGLVFAPIEAKIY